MRHLTQIRLDRLGVALIVASLFFAVIAGAPSAAPRNDQPPKDGGHQKNGSGGGGSTTDTPDSPTAPETPAAPETPKPATDPLQRPAGATTADLGTDAAKAAKRAEAANERTGATAIMAMWCSLALLVNLSNPDNEFSLADAVFGPGFYLFACQEALDYIAELMKLIHDPPDTNFTQVALPTPAATPGVSARCSKRVTARACARIKAAALRYGKALSSAHAAARGLGTSIERFTGANAASSETGRILQAGAAKAYELAAATTELQAAGATFSAALRAARIDARMTPTTRQALIKKLRSRRVSESVLTSLPRSASFTGSLASTDPTAGYSRFERELTVYELAALVQGLHAQGAVSTEVSGWLLDDLRDTITSTTPDERASALSQYEGDVAEVGGPAASLLTAAGQALG